MILYLTTVLFLLQPSHLHKKFICYYYNNNRNPRLVFAPIKTEVAFLEPKIYIFHDLISDREIERLKELASPKVSGSAKA